MNKDSSPQNRTPGLFLRRAPSDDAERKRAVNPRESILVEAPAGSGKTTLLTERFLALLAVVDEPGEIVAITFTNAAAAEMRHRILDELEKAERAQSGNTIEGESASELALAAYAHSVARDWKLLDQPARLRISTIDSFCRELALQQPLLSSFGGELNVASQPEELYREAVRRTLLKLDTGECELKQAIRDLLEWRDNNLSDLEAELVKMLASRDKWLQHFVVAQDLDDTELRLWLERPFAEAACKTLTRASRLLRGHDELLNEVHRMARFGCEQSCGRLYQELAEMSEFPACNYADRETLAEYGSALLCLAQLLLTNEGSYRAALNAKNGFPAAHKPEQLRMMQLKDQFQKIPGFDSALHAVRTLPPPRYDEEDWQIIRGCFTTLRQAAIELKFVFAERGRVDFAEVAGLAQGVLNAGLNATGEAAFAVAEGIRHILVDEFQDTSRVQHRLLGSIVREWPEREGRSVFVVGDPMQSIYFFRNAEAELFIRSREQGLDVPDESPLPFKALKLTANFRTQPALVKRLNRVFQAISTVDDGSSFTFASAVPAREESESAIGDGLELHLKFVPQICGPRAERAQAQDDREAAQMEQLSEIVELCRSYARDIEKARNSHGKFRVAILGRTKSALTPIAEALRDAGLSFRAVDLEPLSGRPEVQDALALARALLNPEDRVNWLGVLRAPWCGLELNALHELVSEDDPTLLRRTVPELIVERMHRLDDDARERLTRVVDAVGFAGKAKAANPNAALGTWLESVWLRLGGAACVEAAERVNLDLLWRAIDGLPNGEKDLLGTALVVALDDLKSQPDPGSSSECGIQLMTLHKSKGLEFEVVIVPQLQAAAKVSDVKMLSWLERGKVSDSEDDEPTEFLVVPFQSKGKERGDTKKWVDGVIRDCERQEMRRLLYVAATRAREELHLFAQPEYKSAKNGDLVLADQKESLLGIAWPAFADEVQTEFDEWSRARRVRQLNREELALAAGGELFPFPKTSLIIDRGRDRGRDEDRGGNREREPSVRARLRRLPKGFEGNESSKAAAPTAGIPVPARLYLRQQGGLQSRLLGTAIHRLLEKLAGEGARNGLVQLAEFRPRLIAETRASGLTMADAARIVDQALKVSAKAAEEPIGRWVLGAHRNAASEVRWTGLLDGELRQVQIDRVFQAGSEPLSLAEDSNEPVWWIIDYKSGESTERLEKADLEGQREFYRPQIATYARVLREMHGAGIRIHGAIYYPRPGLLDWWETEA